MTASEKALSLCWGKSNTEIKWGTRSSQLQLEYEVESAPESGNHSMITS